VGGGPWSVRELAPFFFFFSSFFFHETAFFLKKKSFLLRRLVLGGRSVPSPPQPPYLLLASCEIGGADLLWWRSRGASFVRSRVVLFLGIDQLFSAVHRSLLLID